MEDAKTPVTIEGIVYNEMQGITHAIARVQELPVELRNMANTVTQEELDGYKLAVLSELLAPVGQWDAAY